MNWVNQGKSTKYAIQKKNLNKKDWFVEGWIFSKKLFN
jgi:hypothetical protein